jgi:hypothetical protein
MEEKVFLNKAVIVPLAVALAEYATELSERAAVDDFYGTRVSFGWLKTIFEQLEEEVKK